jgi:hypothetical protein
MPISGKRKLIERKKNVASGVVDPESGFIEFGSGYNQDPGF